MKTFVPQRHLAHTPQMDYSDGLPPFAHMETPERLSRIAEGLSRAGYRDRVSVEDISQGPVRAIHDADYVDFLVELAAGLEADAQYLPTVFGGDLSQAPLARRGGMYCREIGTPLGGESVRAAFNSAAAAAHAAEYAAGGRDAFALCRPPGHHAGRRRYGGYCLFNNAYVAAHALERHALRCAVVDLDYHLGDGSMEFATAACPYFSLHADPFLNYPYLDRDARPDASVVTLCTFPPDIEGAAYLELADRLLLRAAQAAPELLIVSLGFDTLGSDYIQDQTTGITESDYAPLGERVAQIQSPLLFVMEGGYDLDHLTQCAAQFFTGFARAR